MMKALSVKQPWAGMIAAGLKTIETRTWATGYRGPILLVASKKPVYPGQVGQCSHCLQFSDRVEFDVIGADTRNVFCNICGKETGVTFFDASLSGRAQCIAELAECHVMSKLDEAAACCRIYPGAYSWVLENIRPLKPFEVKGQLGLFDVQLTNGVVL